MKLGIKILAFLINATLYSQQATSLYVADTRNINSNPNFYANSLTAEFKLKDVVGVPGENGFSGMLTLAPWSDESGGKVHQLNFNNAGVYYRNGLQSSQWGNWSKMLMQNLNGNVKVDGTHENSFIHLQSYNQPNPDANLTLWASEPAVSWTGVGIGNNVRNYVNGQPFTRINTNVGGSYIRLLDNEINFNLISNTGVKHQSFTLYNNGNASLHGKLDAKEIRVTQSPTADFVFEEDYELPTLEAVEKHIKEKKHLPETASAKEMEKEGVNVGEFQIKLLQKIEELTLYSIKQNKKIQQLESENQKLKTLFERIEKLEKDKELTNQ